MEVSFCALRAKEVVNICDGKRLGNIIDMVIETKTARVVGIVVPGDKRYFGLFRASNDIFIPYHRICKIGRDVILVELTPNNGANCVSCSTDAGSTVISDIDKKNYIGNIEEGK